MRMKLLTGICSLSLLGCGLATTGDDQKSDDNTPSNDIKEYFQGASSGNSSDISTVWSGQCMTSNSPKNYRMQLIGNASSGKYSVSGNGSTTDTEGGLYKSNGNIISFGDEQAETFGYKAMSCELEKREIIVNNKKYSSYLECSLGSSNKIAFFSECPQIQFVSAKKLISQDSEADSSEEAVETNAPMTSTTLVAIPANESDWNFVDENESIDVFEADLSGTCENGKEVTMVVDKNLFTITVKGSRSSDSGAYHFNKNDDTMELKEEESLIDRTIGSCRIKENKQVICQFTKSLNVSFFQGCSIARFDLN